MNKERAKELLPIIEAFVNGKVIEYLFVGEWRVATCPDWTPGVKYRIRQEPKLIPFTFEDNLLFRDKWIRLKKNDFNRYLKIVSYESDVVSIKNQSLSYGVLFKDYTFEDGSPCGKYVNE